MNLHSKMCGVRWVAVYYAAVGARMQLCTRVLGIFHGTVAYLVCVMTIALPPRLSSFMKPTFVWLETHISIKEYIKPCMPGTYSAGHQQKYCFLFGRGCIVH